MFDPVPTPISPEYVQRRKVDPPPFLHVKPADIRQPRGPSIELCRDSERLGAVQRVAGARAVPTPGNGSVIHIPQFPPDYGSMNDMCVQRRR